MLLCVLCAYLFSSFFIVLGVHQINRCLLPFLDIIDVLLSPKLLAFLTVGGDFTLRSFGISGELTSHARSGGKAPYLKSLSSQSSSSSSGVFEK